MQQTFLHPRPLFLLKENKPRREVVCRLASRAPAVLAGRVPRPAQDSHHRAQWRARRGLCSAGSALLGNSS